MTEAELLVHWEVQTSAGAAVVQIELMLTVTFDIS